MYIFFFFATAALTEERKTTVPYFDAVAHMLFFFRIRANQNRFFATISPFSRGEQRAYFIFI